MRVRDLIVSSFLLLLTLILVGKNLDKPFWGIHDWNGARYGNIARNYLRYPVFTHKFSQIENGGVVGEGKYRYLTHYPPLLPILISLSYRLMGVNEVATRLIPLLATAGTIITFYFIGRTILNWRVGLMAATLALATPMVRYFGTNPVHEPLALFFGSLAFLGVLLVIKNKKKGWFLIWIGVILGLLNGWQGVYLILALSILLIKKVGRQKLSYLWLVAAFFVVLHFAHTKYITGSFLGGGLADVFLQRTALGGAAKATPFTLYEFINRVRLWASANFTLSLILTTLIGVYYLTKEKSRQTKLFFVSFFIFGIGYPLTFPNATYIHSYFIYPMTLFLSFISAYAVFTLSQKSKSPLILIFILVFLAVWFERTAYLRVLEESASDKFAVEIGKEIMKETQIEDTIFVNPFSFASSRYPHLTFYSDRNIVLNPDSEYNWEAKIDEENQTFQILPAKK
ncbi:glycosyltransferase family 39 protein [Patescibacteria group bacterium]|nr:glycosyltransferase family 39 protein [Patescibacteria group bacterium]